MAYDDWVVTKTGSGDITVFADSGGQSGDCVTGYSLGTDQLRMIRFGSMLDNLEISVGYEKGYGSTGIKFLARFLGASYYAFKIAAPSNGNPNYFNAVIEKNGAVQINSPNKNANQDMRSNWTNFRFTCEDVGGQAELKFYWTPAGGVETLGTFWNDPSPLPEGEVGWEWVDTVADSLLSRVDELVVSRL